MTRLIAARESERLDALRSLQIMDTSPEPELEAICRNAVETFDVRIAYVAFIDVDRQWVKAACGPIAESIPREVSFCSRTILFDVPLVVADATLDRRFARNPGVVGPPGIRFYAGLPLSLDAGLRVGTFCLIDVVPHYLTAKQVARLREFGEAVVDHLRAHRATLVH